MLIGFPQPFLSRSGISTVRTPLSQLSQAEHLNRSSVVITLLHVGLCVDGIRPRGTGESPLVGQACQNRKGGKYDRFLA